MASRYGGGYPSDADALPMATGPETDEMGEQAMGVDDSRNSPTDGRMSVHEAMKVRKAVDKDVQSIENRIQYMAREEEKIWKDLELVRRQATALEEGRERNVEKKMSDQQILQARELRLQANRQRAAAMRQTVMEQQKTHQFEAMQAKQKSGQEQRRQSAEILTHKRMQDAQKKLLNSEKAVAAQRTALEAKFRVNQDKAERLEKLRGEQEYARLVAQQDVQDAESKLPDLQAQEMMMLQRLQNSRLVTQSVLQNLETSLGANSSVATLLRSKQQRVQDPLNSVGDTPGTPGALEPALEPEPADNGAH